MSGSRFTPDEIVNMQVRYAAGEPVQSIADDYDTSRNSIYYHVSPVYREGRIRRNSRRNRSATQEIRNAQDRNSG